MSSSSASSSSTSTPRGVFLNSSGSSSSSNSSRSTLSSAIVVNHAELNSSSSSGGSGAKHSTASAKVYSVDSPRLRGRGNGAVAVARLIGSPLASASGVFMGDGSFDEIGSSTGSSLLNSPAVNACGSPTTATATGLAVQITSDLASTVMSSDSPSSQSASQQQQQHHHHQYQQQSNGATSQTRKRHRSTKEQQQVLNEAFAREQHPTSQVREKLAEQLGMDPRSVQIWFQNRRASAKRQLIKKSQEEAQLTQQALLAATALVQQQHGHRGSLPGVDALALQLQPNASAALQQIVQQQQRQLFLQQHPHLLRERSSSVAAVVDGSGTIGINAHGSLSFDNTVTLATSGSNGGAFDLRRASIAVPLISPQTAAGTGGADHGSLLSQSGLANQASLGVGQVNVSVSAAMAANAVHAMRRSTLPAQAILSQLAELDRKQQLASSAASPHQIPCTSFAMGDWKFELRNSSPGAMIMSRISMELNAAAHSLTWHMVTLPEAIPSGMGVHLVKPASGRRVVCDTNTIRSLSFVKMPDLLMPEVEIGCVELRLIDVPLCYMECDAPTAPPDVPVADSGSIHAGRRKSLTATTLVSPSRSQSGSADDTVSDLRWQLCSSDMVRQRMVEGAAGVSELIVTICAPANIMAEFISKWCATDPQMKTRLDQASQDSLFIRRRSITPSMQLAILNATTMASAIPKIDVPTIESRRGSTINLAPLNINSPAQPIPLNIAANGSALSAVFSDPATATTPSSAIRPPLGLSVDLSMALQSQQQLQLQLQQPQSVRNTSHLRKGSLPFTQSGLGSSSSLLNLPPTQLRPSRSSSGLSNGVPTSTTTIPEEIEEQQQRYELSDSAGVASATANSFNAGQLPDSLMQFLEANTASQTQQFAAVPTVTSTAMSTSQSHYALASNISPLQVTPVGAARDLLSSRRSSAGNILDVLTAQQPVPLAGSFTQQQIQQALAAQTLSASTNNSTSLLSAPHTQQLFDPSIAASSLSPSLASTTANGGSALLPSSSRRSSILAISGQLQRTNNIPLQTLGSLATLQSLNPSSSLPSSFVGTASTSAINGTNPAPTMSNNTVGTPGAMLTTKPQIVNTTMPHTTTAAVFANPTLHSATAAGTLTGGFGLTSNSQFLVPQPDASSASFLKSLESFTTGLPLLGTSNGSTTAPATATSATNTTATGLSALSTIYPFMQLSQIGTLGLPQLSNQHQQLQQAYPVYSMLSQYDPTANSASTSAAANGLAGASSLAAASLPLNQLGLNTAAIPTSNAALMLQQQQQQQQQQQLQLQQLQQQQLNLARSNQLPGFATQSSLGGDDVASKLFDIPSLILQQQQQQQLHAASANQQQSQSQQAKCDSGVAIAIAKV